MAIDYAVLAQPKVAKAPRRPSKATLDKAVYAHVTERDRGFCRACGDYAGISAERHHLRGRLFTTIQDCALVCRRCHNWLHVRVGGKKLKLYGNAEERNSNGALCGLVAEWRQPGDTWLVERGL